MNSTIHNHIVIDNGSHTVKTGFNGENAPRSVVPNIIGKFKNTYNNFLFDEDTTFIGNDCIFNSSNLKLSYPLEDVSKNFNIEEIDDLWSYVFEEDLKVNPEAFNVFLIANFVSNDSIRNAYAEIMYEYLNVYNLYIENHGPLSLWSTAKSTGLIVESDHLNTYVYPIFDKHIIAKGIKSLSFAGLELTKCYERSLLQTLPRNMGNILNVDPESNVSNLRFLAQNIKEKHSRFSCKNSNRPSIDLNNNNKETFILPDGNKLELDSSLFNIADVMFEPELLGYDFTPLHKTIKESIMECDIHTRKDILSNIVLAGGNTLIDGFKQSLKYYLIKEFGEEYSDIIKVNAQKDRKYAMWMGGSVVCSLSNFQNLWVSKNDYEEMGSNVFFNIEY